MSRKPSNYKRSSLGQLLKGLHKSNPKVLAEEQKVSKKNEKKSILKVDWNGHGRFIRG